MPADLRSVASRLLADSGSLQGTVGAGFGAGLINSQQRENNDCGILGIRISYEGILVNAKMSFFWLWPREAQRSGAESRASAGPGLNKPRDGLLAKAFR